MNYGLRKFHLFLVVAGFILTGLLMRLSKPQINSSGIYPAFSLYDEPSNLDKDTLETLEEYKPLPIPKLSSESDYYNEKLDEYLSDPENEIDYNPEIFDFLDD